MSHVMNVFSERIGREWMVLLLGLGGETNERGIEAVKEFLERLWRARDGQQVCIGHLQSQNMP